jgi:MoxR-like ATPase
MIVGRTARYLAAEQSRYKAKPEDYEPLMPSTWLNQQRFLDEPSAIPVPPKKVLYAAWTASGKRVVVTGSSGTGKTRLLAQHVDACRT